MDKYIIANDLFICLLWQLIELYYDKRFDKDSQDQLDGFIDLDLVLSNDLVFKNDELSKIILFEFYCYNILQSVKFYNNKIKKYYHIKRNKIPSIFDSINDIGSNNISKILLEINIQEAEELLEKYLNLWIRDKLNRPDIKKRKFRAIHQIKQLEDFFINLYKTYSTDDILITESEITNFKKFDFFTSLIYLSKNSVLYIFKLYPLGKYKQAEIKFDHSVYQYYINPVYPKIESIGKLEYDTKTASLYYKGEFLHKINQGGLPFKVLNKAFDENINYEVEILDINEDNWNNETINNSLRSFRKTINDKLKKIIKNPHLNTDFILKRKGLSILISKIFIKKQ